MERYISRKFEGWATLKPDTVDDLIELVKDIRKMPTGYFEAKPQRAVGLDEIEAVVIPNTTSQNAIEAINKAGIKTVTYDASDKSDRLKKLNEVADSKEGIRFSLGSRAKGRYNENSDLDVVLEYDDYVDYGDYSHRYSLSRKPQSIEEYRQMEARPLPPAVKFDSIKELYGIYKDSYLGQIITTASGHTMTFKPGHFFRLICHNNGEQRKGFIEKANSSQEAIQMIENGEIQPGDIAGYQRQRGRGLLRFKEILEDPDFYYPEKKILKDGTVRDCITFGRKYSGFSTDGFLAATLIIGDNKVGPLSFHPRKFNNKILDNENLRWNILPSPTDRTSLNGETVGEQSAEPNSILQQIQQNRNPAEGTDSNGKRVYSLSSDPDNKSDVEKIKDYVDGKMGIKLSDDDARDLKTLMGTDKDSDLGLNDIPTMKNQAEAIKGRLADFLSAAVDGIFGDVESRAERKKAPYLWQREHNTEPEIETPFEISRRHKIEEGMKIRDEEDRLVLKHLDADKNFFTGLVRKYFEPGPLRDWILKKVSRVLAPFQMMKPVENLLFTVAENIMWDETKRQMVIAPQRTALIDPQTNKPVGYKYDANQVKGKLALDIYNNRLNDDFKAIIKERSIANNQFREDFVNRVVPLEQAKLYLARYARKRLDGSSQKIIDGNDQQAYSYITKLKGVIDDIDYNSLISQYDQVHSIPDAQLGRNSAHINSVIGELTGSRSISASGIDRKLNWLNTNKGLYGYVHHLISIDPETGGGKPFNALGRVSHPWIETIAKDRLGRTGEKSSYRSLLKSDLERSRKEAEAEAANRWMEDIENQYGITIEEAESLEKLEAKGKGPGMPEGYEHRNKVVANFGKFRGKVVYLPDEIYEAYRLARDNSSLDFTNQLGETWKFFNRVNGRINQAMLWHPAKAMRDLMSGPFHIAEFLMDYAKKHPADFSDACEALVRGVKNAVSPEYWQSHTPESLGEYSESVIYQDRENQSPLFSHLNSLFKFFQNAIPVGDTAEAIYREVNLSGAADIPLKRIFTTVGEELADKKGLKGQERKQFIYDLVNDYCFYTDDLPKYPAFFRGKNAGKLSQSLGVISLATFPFFGYTARMIKQMITDPVTKGAVPLTKRMFGKTEQDSSLRNELSELSRPFCWLLIKALISAGLGGMLPPPTAEEIQDMPGVPPSARTHTRFHVGDSEKGERYMSVKGLGQLETAMMMDDYLKGKSDIIDLSSEFLTIHPIAKYVANLTGMYSEYDKKVPFTTQTGKLLGNLIYPELTTRFTDDLSKIISAYSERGITDRSRQTFLQAFIEKLTGLPRGEVIFDGEGHLRLSDKALETLKMLGVNVKEIPFDTIEKTARAEASRISNDAKRIQKLGDYRAGKYAPKTEQEFLKQDFGGDFSGVDEAEQYYSNIAERERKVVDTATKLHNKGHWTDLEDVAREKKELAAEKRKQQNEGKPTKRRRTTRRRKTERPLLNDDLNYINSDIRKNIYKSQKEEYQDFYNRLIQNNKKHNPRRGVAGQLEKLLKELK